MIHKDADRLDIDDGRIFNKGDVLRKIPAKLFRQSRLGLGSSHRIVIARRDHDLQPVRQCRHKVADMIILFIDGLDLQLLVLIRINTDPVHHIAGDQQIADVFAFMHPFRELFPSFWQKRIAADMDIRDEHSFSFFFRRGYRIRQRDLRPKQRIGKDHLGPAHTVARQLTFHADDFVRDDRFGLGKPVTVFVEKHLDRSGRILHLNDPVTFRAG